MFVDPWGYNQTAVEALRESRELAALAGAYVVVAEGIVIAASGVVGYAIGSALEEKYIQGYWGNLIYDILHPEDNFNSCQLHGEDPEGKTGHCSKWDKHSGRRSGEVTGDNRNNNRGKKNKKSNNPSKKIERDIFLS